MKELTPTLVIAVIALVSPIITNWMNNRHLERIKLLDFTNSHSEDVFNRKVRSIELFLQSANKLRNRLENSSVKYIYQGTLATVEASENKDSIIDLDGFKDDILLFNKNLATLIPLVNSETMIKLFEFNEFINSGNSFGQNLLKEFTEIANVLHKEVDNSKPDYNEYRPKEIKDIFFRIFKHVDITKKSNENN
ncbi:hypothetical protein [uncultured Enterococcus sp.]|uniref:hypothetical protein n=1 Tax=uncultured Enterococcus sp. TaxID=167972 RepID=UPI0025828D7F|nr:hypothetical protein [uncultured Enterococcus sp.]